MSEDIQKGKGHGYIDKKGKICMESCFACGKENYAMAVSSGTCAWCGHNPNKKPVRKVAHKEVRGPSPLANVLKLLILQDQTNKEFIRRHGGLK
jgi:ribosomal protein L37E